MNSGLFFDMKVVKCRLKQVNFRVCRPIMSTETQEPHLTSMLCKNAFSEVFFIFLKKK
jgi:hypothetical protein